MGDIDDVEDAERDRNADCHSGVKPPISRPAMRALISSSNDKRPVPPNCLFLARNRVTPADCCGSVQDGRRLG